MVMPGDVRSDSAGVARVTVHFFSPVLASYATIRLSTLRTTTTSAPTAGADSTSLDACAVQSCLPLPSKARIWPLTPPTTTSVPSVLTPTPAVRSVPALTRHCCLPVAAFRRAMAPSASATKISPPASAGENTAAPDLPIEYFHASCTFRSALKSVSLAGGVLLSFEPNSEQPAISASTPAAIAFSVLRISFNLDLYNEAYGPRRAKPARRRTISLVKSLNNAEKLRRAFGDRHDRHAAADRFQFQLDQLAARVLAVGRLVGGQISGAGFGQLVLRDQDIALAVGHGAGELRRHVAGQCGQRGVVRFLVEQHTGQAYLGDGLELRLAMFGHPLQLGLGGFQVGRVERGLGGGQRAHLRIGGAAVTALHVAGGALHLGVVLGDGGALQLVVQRRRLRGLAALVVVPAGPAGVRGQAGDQHPRRQIAVAVPPRFKGSELFLFFEIVCHVQVKVNVTVLRKAFSYGPYQ